MPHATYMDFGPFILRQLLGRSRAMDLWLAERRDALPGSLFLVRRLLPAYAQGEGYAQEFFQRCQELQRLAPEGILVPVQLEVVKDIPCAVLPGGLGWRLPPLLQHLRQTGQPLPLNAVAQLCLSVARGLASCHARLPVPLVHGALSPASVWIAPEGRVALGDLELGTLAEIELTSQKQEERAWRFQAPERAADWQHPGTAVDVFSLSALILEVVGAGRLSEVELRLEPLEQLPVLKAKGVSATLLTCVEEGLSEDPAVRPSMAALVTQLAERAAGPEGLAQALKDCGLPPPVYDPLSAQSKGDVSFLNMKALKRPILPPGVTSTPELAMPTGAARPGRSRGLALALIGVVLIGLTVAGVLYRGAVRTLVLGPGGALVKVSVVSSPPGAEIRQGETVVGHAPFTRPLRPGPDRQVVLTATLEGYQRGGPLSLEAKGGETLEFAFRLEPVVHGPAQAHITSEPAGASIQVDGKARGRAPVEVGGLFSGEPHTLVATLAGYQVQTQTFRVTPEEATTVAVKMVRLRAVGAGTGSGSAGSAQARGPETGAGVGPAKGGKGCAGDAGLGAASGAEAVLVLRVGEASCVEVDGRPRGRVTGERKLRVPAGRHLVSVRGLESGKAAQREVAVSAEDVKVVAYDGATGAWSLAPYRP